jgi:hypothetical protein
MEQQLHLKQAIVDVNQLMGDRNTTFSFSLPTSKVTANNMTSWQKKIVFYAEVIKVKNQVEKEIWQLLTEILLAETS